MDKIPVETEKPVVQYYVAPQREKRVGISTLLTSFAVALLAAVVLIYLADISAVISLTWKDITINGLLIFICSQAFHYVLKALAQTRVRDGKEYKEAEEKAKTAIEELGRGEYSARVAEYCAAHTAETLARVRDSILNPAGIRLSDFEEKYVGKSTEEIVAAYPSSGLSEAQLKAVARANKIRVKPYDPNFLRSFMTGKDGVEPSYRYRPHYDNKIDTLRTALSGVIFGVLAVNMSGIVLSWSAEAVVLCVVKLFFTVFSGIMGYWFGSNNARTEISVLITKSDEAEACAEWCRRNPVQQTEKFDTEFISCSA